MSNNRIFVFASNLAGRHGKGSAYEAVKKHGAIYGQGTGRQGQSYAIPTKDQQLQVMPLGDIAGWVADFLEYALSHPELDFDVVAIGCGLAGYKPAQIAWMFDLPCPRNVFLPPEFLECLSNDQ